MKKTALLNCKVKNERLDGCDNCESENLELKSQTFSEIERTALIFGQTEDDMSK